MVREANLRIEYKKALAGGSVNMPPSRKVRTKETIEKVILKTAKKNKGLATPSEVALEGDISIEDAKNYLEKLVSKGFAESEVRGWIEYLRERTDYLVKKQLALHIKSVTGPPEFRP